MLLNLVTGVFVDTAHSMRKHDRRRELDRGLISSAEKAGISMDDDVSDQMFGALLKRHGMSRFLEVQDMDETTCRRVFALLRERNGGRLSLNDFIVYYQRLRGLGNAIELAGLHLTDAKYRRHATEQFRCLRSLSETNEELLLQLQRAIAGHLRPVAMADHTALPYCHMAVGGRVVHGRCFGQRFVR